MEDWVGLAVWGDREIWWYELHGNGTWFSRMVAEWFTHYAAAANQQQWQYNLVYSYYFNI